MGSDYSDPMDDGSGDEKQVTNERAELIRYHLGQLAELVAAQTVADGRKPITAETVALALLTRVETLTGDVVAS
jgi:hypothetical protein